MRIALDYDKTYTADPALWDGFISLANERGHQVCIVTMRYPDTETIESPPAPVVYTRRTAKCKLHQADVWIDDNPAWIYQDAP
jgi:hypothetical protein